MSRQELEGKFGAATLKRNNLKAHPRVLQELMMFMEQSIRNQFRGFSFMLLCGGSDRTKFLVDKCFQRAFESMSLEEKVHRYEKIINCALGIDNRMLPSTSSRVEVELSQEVVSQLPTQPQRFRIEIPQGFSTWNGAYVTLDGFKMMIKGELNIDLRNYILRRSKKSGRECYALQAIRDSQPETLRFSFMTNGDKQQFLPSIRDRVDRGFEEMVGRMVNQEKGSRYKTELEESMTNSVAGRIEIKLLKAPSETSHNEEKNLIIEKKIPSIQNRVPEPQIELGLQSTSRVRSTEKLELPEPQPESLFKRFTPPSSNKKDSLQQGEEINFVAELLKKNTPTSLAVGDLSVIVEEENERLSKKFSIEPTVSPLESLVLQVIKHYRKDIFSVMFPFFRLNLFHTFQSHRSIDHIQDMKVLQSILNLKLFRFELDIQSLSPIQVIRALCDHSLYQRWHPCMHQAAIKLKISSQNSCICYERHKKVAQQSRQRDFLFIRHMLRLEEHHYICDKSIQHHSYPAYHSIQRGKIAYRLMRFEHKGKGTKVVGEVQMQHEGVISDDEQYQLTLQYIEGLKELEEYYGAEENKNDVKKYYEQDWHIRPKQPEPDHPQLNAMVSARQSLDIPSPTPQEASQDDVFFSIHDSVLQLGEDILQMAMDSSNLGEDRPT